MKESGAFAAVWTDEEEEEHRAVAVDGHMTPNHLMAVRATFSPRGCIDHIWRWVMTSAEKTDAHFKWAEGSVRLECPWTLPPCTRSG